MSRRRTLGLGVLLAVVVMAALWHRFGPGEVPPGQPPLVTLDASSLETLQAAFNRDVDRTRIVILLSPT